MVIFINHCSNFIQNSLEEFKRAISDLVNETKKIQFILISHMPKEFSLSSPQIEKFQISDANLHKDKKLSLNSIDMHTEYIHNSYLE